jgi:hypothetical protein
MADEQAALFGSGQNIDMSQVKTQKHSAIV